MSAVMLLSIILTLLVLGFLFKKIWACSGLLRLPGGITILAMVFVITKIALDVQANPSTHNLLPFELIAWNILFLMFYWVAVAGMDWVVKQCKKPRGRV